MTHHFELTSKSDLDWMAHAKHVEAMLDNALDACGRLTAENCTLRRQVRALQEATPVKPETAPKEGRVSVYYVLAFGVCVAFWGAICVIANRWLK